MNARGIRVAGVMEGRDLLIREVLREPFGGVDANRRVAVARTEHDGLTVRDIRGRGGRREHEQMGVLGLLGDRQRTSGRGGTHELSLIHI